MEEVSNNNTSKIADSNDYDIYLAQEYINTTIPISAIFFPEAEFPITFYQTRETLSDIEKYKSFIDNCIRRFRKSRFYKSYKSYLMSMGMDRCQINGNIQDGMASIEMHHNFLTIYDITILISQHLLNTIGRCTTFDIITLLCQEHKFNNIPIVMLSETAHQLYHDNPDFYIPVSMNFKVFFSGSRITSTLFLCPSGKLYSPIISNFFNFVMASHPLEINSRKKMS